MNFINLGVKLIDFPYDIFLLKSHSSKNDVSATLHSQEIVMDSQVTGQST